MPIFINRENQSNKFWKYDVNGLSVHVSWGRIGGSSESQVKTFSSHGSMHDFISTKVSEKTRKGYREASENELLKEVQTAKSLGIENKIQRLLLGATPSRFRTSRQKKRSESHWTKLPVTNSRKNISSMKSNRFGSSARDCALYH